MRILVTGGAGFLGRHVATGLAAAGHDVVVFDQRDHGELPTVRGDLLDASAVRAAAGQVEAICHLGAVGDVYLAFERPELAAAVNVTGTANVVDAALRAGLKKVVYASTWEVYGEPHYQPVDEQHPTNPDHPYNITKLAGEQLALSYDRLKGVPVLALRVGTAYGTGMRPNSVFHVFIERAVQRLPLVIQGSGAQTRQFTHASDIARAFGLAVESSLHGQALNIVGNEACSIRRLAEAVAERLPTEIRLGEPRVGDVAPSRVSNRRARETLGWSPAKQFEDGLEELIVWQLGLEKASSPAA